MSRRNILEEFPEDILSEQIKYLSPHELDVYCSIDENIHKKCLNRNFIRLYIKNKGLDRNWSNVEEGLIWAVKENSLILVDFFINEGAVDIERALRFLQKIKFIFCSKCYRFGDNIFIK